MLWYNQSLYTLLEYKLVFLGNVLNMCIKYVKNVPNYHDYYVHRYVHYNSVTKIKDARVRTIFFCPFVNGGNVILGTTWNNFASSFYY